jgi:hypothetical protein
LAASMPEIFLNSLLVIVNLGVNMEFIYRTFTAEKQARKVLTNLTHRLNIHSIQRRRS